MDSARSKYMTTAVILSFIISFLLSQWIYDYKYFTTPGIKISFSLKGNHPVELKLYYLGTESNHFTPANLIRQVCKLSSAPTEVSLSIPQRETKSIRFDIGNFPGKLQFSEINVNNRALSISDWENAEKRGIDAFRHNDDGSVELESGHREIVVIFKDFSSYSAPVSIHIKISAFVLTFAIIFFCFAQSYKIMPYRQELPDIIFVVLVFIALLLPLTRIDQNKVSKAENRTLASYEPLFNAGVFNYKYGIAFESFISDHFRGRDFLIKQYQRLKMIDRQDGNDKVLVGKNGWLFYKEHNSLKNYANADMFTDEQLARIGEKLSALNSWCEKNKTRLYLIIAPDKNRIYGEHMRMVRKLRPDSESRAQQLVDHLSRNTKVKTLYLRDALLAAKSNTNELLYYKLDTHWTRLGAYYGYMAIINFINKDIPVNPAVIEENVKYGFEDDIYRQYPEFRIGEKYETKPDLLRMFPEYGLQEQNVCVFPRPKIAFNRIAIPREQSYETAFATENKAEKYNVSVYCDSFCGGLLPYLSGSFKSVKYFWRLRDVRKTVEKGVTDILILEYVERAIPSLYDLTVDVNQQVL